MPDGRHRLFVYGSLLAREPNAWRLRGAPCLGPAATLAVYDLLDLGGYPALRPGGQTSVKGELYLVDDARLAALDEYEGHPTLFRRAEIALAGGGAAHAYLAPALVLGARVIASGDWRRHRRAR